MILYYKFRALLVAILLRVLPRKSPLVFTGSGSSLQLAGQVKLLGFDKVLLVTDEFLGSSGILDGIKGKLDETGVAYAVYAGVLPDPSFDQVQEGFALLQREQCQAVIGVGGGSVLDASKMISLLPNNPYPLSALAGVQKIKKAGLPLFLVPTTAGTGAEITIAAVITDPSTHQKAPVADTKLVPSYIALDADIMLGLPPGITAATGMDALTHAVESWLTRYGTEDADRLAKSATRLVFNYLERAWQDGSDREAREAMAMAAFYAGAAFSQTSVGYVHGIAHQLGRVCGTPHGNANAMVLPEVLSAYGDCVYPKLAELADLVGIEGSSEAARAQAFIQAIHDMRARMEMPLKPKDLRPDQIPDIVKEAVKETGELYPVPRYMADSELSAIVNGLLA